MPDQIFIGQAPVAAGQAQEMNRVEQVRFAHAVQSHETIKPGRQVQRLVGVIFKIGQF